MTDNAKLAEALTDLPTADWSPYRALILHALRKNATGQVLEGAAHTDHPMRHYDRTCPACNPDAPNRIAIGQFILRQSDAHDDKVWIFTSGGEGGIFDANKLADVLGDFYAENF